MTGGSVLAVSPLVIGMVLAGALLVLAGALLSRARVRYRVTESQLRAILDNLADGVVTADGDGLVRVINPAAQVLFGWEAEELVGRPAARLLPDPERPNEPSGLLARDHALDGECLGRHRDGHDLPIELNISRVSVGGHALTVGLVRDLRERRLREAVDDLVHAMNHMVLEGRRLDEVMHLVSRRLKEMFRLEAVWIGTRAPDGTVTARAAAGVGLELVRGLGVRWDGRPGGGDPTGAAIRLGRTQRAAVEEAEWAEALAGLGEAGWSSAVAIPLASRQQVAGALTIYARLPPESGLVRRLEAVATRIGVAMRMALDQERLRLQGAAMASAADPIFITDRDGRIEWVNLAFTRLTGYALDEVVGNTPRLLKSGVQTQAFYEDMWRHLRSGDVWRGEVVERRKDGTLYTVEQTVTPMLDFDGQVSHFVVVHEDITDRKKAEERIRFLANFDPLTGLPNRTLFRDRLQQAANRARVARTKLALLFLDLDQFSRVNDTLGHDIGDRVLTAVVERLHAVAHSADTVARVGGDEFAVVQADLANAEAAAALARRIVEAVARPFDIDGHDIHIGASIGITLFPDDGDDPEQLVKNADMAMYRAIREAANGYRFFSNEMNSEVRSRIGLERELRRAVGRDEFVLYYQPQLEAATGRIVGVEALVRWQHPDRGLIPPAHFIPIAEECGLIVPLGDWVMAEACRQIEVWRAQGLDPVTVAVNLSAAQMRQEDLVGRIRRLLDETGTPPHLLEVELTESTVMEDAEAAVRILNAIHSFGLPLAIDDFGTGYSSLSYLKRFPVDRLKIDQSFVRNLATDPNDAEIARAIISLGHSLGLEVVSEGVETEAQLDYLRAEGCDVLQGFLFSRPVPAEAMAVLLSERPFEWKRRGVGV